MITNAKFAALYTTDQDKALAFWKDTLGFEVLTDQPYDGGEPGVRWIEVKPPNGETFIVVSKADESTSNLVGGFSNVWFDCDDLDATYADLKGKGVEFSVAPTEAPWDPSSKWAQFTDPDGTTYGLTQR